MVYFEVFVLKGMYIVIYVIMFICIGDIGRGEEGSFVG